MSDKVVDISQQRSEKNFKNKAEKQQKLKERFEKALPSDNRNSKQKLLDIFKNKKKK